LLINPLIKLKICKLGFDYICTEYLVELEVRIYKEEREREKEERPLM